MRIHKVRSFIKDIEFERETLFRRKNIKREIK